MIFDCTVAFIERTAFKKLFAIRTAKFRPTNLPRLPLPKKLFTRPKICHPDVIAPFRQTPATKASSENAQAVFPRFDSRENRFRFDHNSPLKALSRIEGRSASSSAAVSACRRFRVSTTICKVGNLFSKPYKIELHLTQRFRRTVHERCSEESLKRPCVVSQTPVTWVAFR